MMRPMSSVFSEHQLLHCQTNADVRKGGRGLIKCGHLRTEGGEVGKGVFLWTFFMDDPIISSLCGGRPVWVESAVFWRMPAIFVEREARKGVVHKGRPQRSYIVSQTLVNQVIPFKV